MVGQEGSQTELRYAGSSQARRWLYPYIAMCVYICSFGSLIDLCERLVRAGLWRPCVQNRPHITHSSPIPPHTRQKEERARRDRIRFQLTRLDSTLVIPFELLIFPIKHHQPDPPPSMHHTNRVHPPHPPARSHPIAITLDSNPSA